MVNKLIQKIVLFGNEKTLVDKGLSSFSIHVLFLLLKTRIQGMMV